MNFELTTIVVDNASTDNSVILIKKAFPKIKLIQNQENLGFAEGNNVGIRYALNNGADYIVLLNNDAIISENLIDELLKAAEEKKEAGIFAPKIYFAPGFEFHKERYKKEQRGKVIWYAGGIIDWQNILASHRGVNEVDIGQYEAVQETDFATGCCLMVKREVLKKIGFLDKKYFLYYEDTDFCQRTKLAGYKVLFIPKAILWHLNAGSSGGSGSIIHQYYQARNRFLFGFKYGTAKTKLLLVKEMVKSLILKDRIKKEAVRDFIFGKFGKKTF